MSLELLLAQWDEVIKTPDDVAKLNALILQWAVQGKLVPQCADDEPVQILLEQIQRERDHLVAIKKIRPLDELPLIDDLDQPYDLPRGWMWVRFGEITFNRDGDRIPLSREVRATRQGSYDYYGASGVIDQIDGYLFDKSLLLIGEDGANLINRSTPIAFIAHGKYWVNNHAHVIDALNFDLLDYLRVFINAIDLKPYVTGTAQPKMNQTKMNLIPVALPPHEEQVRIVTKVQELLEQTELLAEQMAQAQAQQQRVHQAVVHQLAHAAAPITPAWQIITRQFDTLYQHPDNIAELKQTILQLAVQGRLVPQDERDEDASTLLKRIVGEIDALARNGKKHNKLQSIETTKLPFKIPSNWVWTRLPEIGQIDPRNDAQDDLMVSFVPMQLVPTDYGEELTSEVRTWGEIRRGYTHFREDDVAFAKITPCFQNRKSTVFRGLTNGIGAGTTELVVFRGNATYILPDYVLLFFKSPRFIDGGVDNMKGTAGQQRVPKTYYLNIPFPLPPFNEQKRIVAKVDELLALCDQLTTHTHTTEAVRLRLRDALLAG